jgi:mevalonate kinase
LYLAHHAEALKGAHFAWKDPYDTPIGVGSSSAQFLLSIAAVANLRGEALPSAEAVLHQYWDTVGATQGTRPSGVDVLAQWSGGPGLFRNEPFLAERLPRWVDRDASFILAFTGVKAKTHEHLQKLRERGFPASFRATLDALNEITLRGVEAWENGDAPGVGAALNTYQDALTQGGLAPEDFTAKLRPLREWAGVLGCKGSGAQGGDCVLLLVRHGHAKTVLRSLRDLGWQPAITAWSNTGLRVDI